MKQWECASAISSQSGASSSKESFLSSLPVAESDATSFMSNSALNVNCKNKSDVCSFMVDVSFAECELLSLSFEMSYILPVGLQVKKYISPESYQQFKVAIRNYSRDHNLDGLIGCFSALCKHPEILKRLCGM